MRDEPVASDNWGRERIFAAEIRSRRRVRSSLHAQSVVRVDEEDFKATDDLVEHLIRNRLDPPHPSITA